MQDSISTRPIDTRRNDQERRERGSDQLRFWGIVSVLLFMPAALVFGILLLTRGRTKSGIWLTLIGGASSVALLIALALALTSTTTAGSWTAGTLETSLKDTLQNAQLGDQEVRSVECVMQTSTQADCIAYLNNGKLGKGEPYNVFVTIDKDTGEYIYR